MEMLTIRNSKGKIIIALEHITDPESEEITPAENAWFELMEEEGHVSEVLIELLQRKFRIKVAHFAVDSENEKCAIKTSKGKLQVTLEEIC